MPYERELQVALEAVEAVRRPVLDAYARFAAIPDAVADIKLTIDRETQEQLLDRLCGAFPEDGYTAEEDTPTLVRLQRQGARTGRRWIVDPIDGTRGFARKNGEFAVMVGLVEGAAVVLGVVLEPVRERLTFAVRGGGCWQGNAGQAAAPCRVRVNADLHQAIMVQSRPSNPDKKSRWVEALRPAQVIQTYSAGIKMAVVACGEADYYLNTYPGVHDWDVCAGHILVEEAGGRVTTRTGQAIRYDQGPDAGRREGLLVSNGALHEAALAAITQVK